jgi:hypothetical protein
MTRIYEGLKLDLLWIASVGWVVLIALLLLLARKKISRAASRLVRATDLRRATEVGTTLPVLLAIVAMAIAGANLFASLAPSQAALIDSLGTVIAAVFMIVFVIVLRRWLQVSRGQR